MSQVKTINMTADSETALAYIIGLLTAIWHEGSFVISTVFRIMLISFGLAIYAAPTFAAILTEQGWVNASPGTTAHNCLVWAFAVASLWIVGILKRVNLNSLIERVTGAKNVINPENEGITVNIGEKVERESS